MTFKQFVSCSTSYQCPRAPLEEHSTVNRKVRGSSPRGTAFWLLSVASLFGLITTRTASLVAAADKSTTTEHGLGGQGQASALMREDGSGVKG